MSSLLRIFVAASALLLTACMHQKAATPAAATAVLFESTDWSRLPGWNADDTLAAWPALLASCRVLQSRAVWQQDCAAAAALNPASSGNARSFLEQRFRPLRVLRVTGRKKEPTGLITGYYEPLLVGSREKTAQFATPLYRRPEDLLTVDLAGLFPELKGKRVRGRLEDNKVVPYYPRAETRGAPALAGHEIVWVDSALDAFLLEVQGSGRVQLTTGETIRLQYDDQNGHPYRSIGKYLVDQGVMPLAQVNIPAIRAWLMANPQRLDEVLNSNPSVVFFREVALENPSAGPPGSLGVPLTAERSIAVDARFIPPGAPVYLSTTQPASTLSLQRLVVAQDTGGAISGPVRADLFFGFGAAAGAQAGLMKQDGQMWLLWPRDAAPPQARDAALP